MWGSCNRYNVSDTSAQATHADSEQASEREREGGEKEGDQQTDRPRYRTRTHMQTHRQHKHKQKVAGQPVLRSARAATLASNPACINESPPSFPPPPPPLSHPPTLPPPPIPPAPPVSSSERNLKTDTHVSTPRARANSRFADARCRTCPRRRPLLPLLSAQLPYLPACTLTLNLEPNPPPPPCVCVRVCAPGP